MSRVNSRVNPNRETNLFFIFNSLPGTAAIKLSEMFISMHTINTHFSPFQRNKMAGGVIFTVWVRFEREERTPAAHMSWGEHSFLAQTHERRHSWVFLHTSANNCPLLSSSVVMQCLSCKLASNNTKHKLQTFVAALLAGGEAYMNALSVCVEAQSFHLEATSFHLTKTSLPY